MILKGWKDVAKYLGCGVRTVQRWERLGLPVRRPTKAHRAPVVSISEELDAWIKLRSPIAPPDSPDAATSQSHSFRYRILLADDNEVFLVSMAARLAREGYEILTARDGFEALALMREGTPDLLVSDLRMPNMSGFELLAVMRRRFPAVAVIAYTGEFIPASDPNPLCDGLVVKGSNSNFELLEMIRDLLSQSPLRTQPARITAVPVWIPRSVNGYFVLTCDDCLRSFSVLTRDGVIGKDAHVKCFHCGVDVRYHIDDSLLPVKDDLRQLARYSSERMALTQAVIQRSREMRETSAQMNRSLRKRRDERSAKAAARKRRRSSQAR